MRLFTSILLAFACALATPQAALAAENPFTVVIDPGHGGSDVGAKGKKALEKDINLAVALKLGKLIEAQWPAEEVKVVYTRKTDKFVPLQTRCDIANKARGDLFISIHVNSVDAKAPNRSSVKGASVYTLGLSRSNENLEVAKRENSVMMLEPDYTTRYCGFDPSSSESYIMFELNQNRHINQSIKFARMAQRQLVGTAGRADKGVRQDIFWVLVHTGMPAVLVELDFICNPKSEEYLASKEGTQLLALSLQKALASYRSGSGAKAATAPATKASTSQTKASRKSTKK